MKNGLQQWIIVAVVLSLVGCAKPPVKDDKELEALVMALVEHNIEMKQKRAERLNRGIKQLEITASEDGYIVSVDLDNASIPVVVRRMFDESGMPYVIDSGSLHGNVTARFQALPFINALNRILEPVGLSAKMDDGIVVIKSALMSISPSESASVYMELPMRNLDMTTVFDLLDGLYPEGMEGREVTFGRVGAINTFYLKGPRESVSMAAQLLLKADREIPHVALEVLVVEFNTADLEEMGTRITDMTDGTYSFSFGYGAEGGRFDYSKDGDEDSSLADFKILSVKAAVEMLVSDQKARLISRPYISTLSGTQAQINIVSDRYVIVDDASGGSSTEPVTSGVILKITPTVLPNGKLRMEVYVEDSQFSSVTVANVSTEVNKNAAETVMQVEDGQTIVVGGLVLNRRAWLNTGFPWLRHVPILNLILAEQTSSYEEKEVSIYITPHIWQPDILSPLIEPEALTSEEDSGVGASIHNLK